MTPSSSEASDHLVEYEVDVIPFRPASKQALSELLESLPNGVDVGPTDVKHLLLRFVERCQQVKKGEPSRIELDAICRLAGMVDNQVQVDGDAELISFLAAAKVESASRAAAEAPIDITPKETADG